MIKIDYDKEIHKWNLWEMGTPEKLIMKATGISIRVPCELIVDDPPHGYLVVSGKPVVDGHTVVIVKDSR